MKNIVPIFRETSSVSPNHSKYKVSGQSTSEYALVIGLVVIASIAGLSAMGNWTNQALSGMIGQRPATTNNTQAALLASLQAALAGQPQPYTNIPNIPGKLMQYPLGNGQTLALSFADDQALLETLGPNGVTENKLAALDQLIWQLEHGDPPGDPAIIGPLKDLSLKGHLAATSQKALQSSVETVWDATPKPQPNQPPAEAQPLISFIPATSRSNQDLSKSLALNTMSASNFKALSKTLQTSQQQTKALQAQKTALDNYFSNNPQPALKGLVEQLYGDINTSLTVTNDLGYGVNITQITPQPEGFSQPDAIAKLIATRDEPLKNHIRSNDLCKLSKASTCIQRP